MTNNCHHHTAEALSNVGIPMTMIRAWWIITTRGRWVSRSHCLMTYVPFFVLMAIIAIVVTIVSLA